MDLVHRNRPVGKMTEEPGRGEPSVALSAYCMKGIDPEWSLIDIYPGIMQFMVV